MGLESKVDKVYDWLRTYIDERKFSANDKLPSENVLCRLLGVSRDTARAAMDRLAKEGLVRRVKGSGTYIRKETAFTRESSDPGAAGKIGLILQGMDKDASAELIRGVKSALDGSGMDLRIFLTDNKFSGERRCLEVVGHQGYDGLIIDGVKASILNPNLDCYYSIYNRSIPIVFYNNYYRDLKFPRIINNDQKCADELIRRLVRAGHRCIAGIFVYDNYQSTEKFQGYVRALRRYGAEFDDNYVKWCISNEAHNISYIREIARFIRNNPKCTAIVCCNYMILQLVLRVLEKNGKRIPEDYSVVCFDYSSLDWRQSRITCSVSRGYDMGVRAGGYLLDMIRMGRSWWRAETVVMEPVIHEGSSIRRL